MNENAGAVQAIFTLALVGVTAAYAGFTWRMADEMRDSRKSALRPIVDVAVNDAAIPDKGDWIAHCHFENVGPGPALNIRYDDVLDSMLRASEWGTLGPGKMTPSGRTVAIVDEDGAYRARVRYEDVFGDRWCSVVTFSKGEGPALESWTQTVVSE